MDVVVLCIGTGSLFLSFLLLLPPLLWGHCDTLEGPVVRDAKAALARSDVTSILKWIPAAHEDEIRAAFSRALAVRNLGPDAQELADRCLFETLVRIHRASEGAPYTGIKEGAAEEESIIAADKALSTGAVDDLVNMVVEKVEHGIRRRFEVTMEKKRHAEQDVEHGRAYVASYVEFIHYGERIYQNAAHPPAHGHASHGVTPGPEHQDTGDAKHAGAPPTQAS